MSLAHYCETIYTSDGEVARPAPEAVVTIYKAGTTTEATLYTTIAGTTTTGNPASANDSGVVSVFLMPGVYDIEVSTAAGTDTRTSVVLSGESRTVAVAGLTHTLTVGDHGNVQQFDSTSDCTVTLFSGAPADYVAYATNIGGGQVLFAMPTGVSTVNNLDTAAAYSLVAARSVDTGVFQLVGNVS